MPLRLGFIRLPKSRPLAPRESETDKAGKGWTRGYVTLSDPDLLTPGSGRRGAGPRGVQMVRMAGPASSEWGAARRIIAIYADTVGTTPHCVMLAVPDGPGQA